jgi:hypothetical protein
MANGKWQMADVQTLVCLATYHLPFAFAICHLPSAI